MCLQATEGLFYPVPAHSILKYLGQDPGNYLLLEWSLCPAVICYLVRKIFEVAKSFFPFSLFFV